MPWLEWLERQNDVQAAGATPYRLLEPVPKLDYGQADSPNMLIQGDNLDALKALLPYYGGQVKCVFIDPPYNTKSAFEHYDDNLEHAKWLSMMYPRLELIRTLMAENASIWITIDDNEAHYLKVICDEVFGRKHFIGNIVWNHSVQSKGYSGKLSLHHNHILGYRKSEAFELLNLPRTEEHNVNYSNPDNDPRGDWRPGDVRNSLVRKNLMYDIPVPSGGPAIKHPPKGWRFSKETFERELAEGKIVFSSDETRIIRKIYLEDQEGRVPESLWFAQDVGTTREANKEVRALIEDDYFETPKPERLIERILRISTREGELVLDSFLGSGTTAAVAHKLGRQWIGIEVGEHAITLCRPRLQAVVDGEQGGISSEVKWPETGGGGFRFYRLGPTVFDENGHIRDGIKFEWLAAHVWFAETGSARSTRARKVPLLGVHEGVAYYLLFNGVLGDKRPDGGNVLTLKVLAELPEHDGPKVIYGEASRLGPERLKALGITFRQTPYDIKAR
ncbi:site-specific DNA-methyltransferase [Xanthomonas campestris]|uniref:site-specific DNA-methyltransferase n=1 Tax=Xanthomonas campestris TaxID=339 RepID=UPI000309EE80|nr:site-specific DNA-methyltransferase [Xanthomonas campestris]MEA0930739.1 site-specific DNA-methyltransferase [Xanthomonas campestris pv. campestris]MEB1561342.1 site-specific DNA-methyltransferase [Xanthomonas campestris pv. campestris]MEB1717249.1 site-specific DNA-methyltransferase [Xanthomonas campestris pv. campestris]MEB1747488.1 site-specific DNA-methyltransferase [Xanthomonas campestris pv. campestris]MEB1868505.1 site-specific DNA-methyltransferase [Xanthomonas campestris pv. campes